HDSGRAAPAGLFVVPDAVAGTRWQFPRQFDSGTLDYEGPFALTARARSNVVRASLRLDVLWGTMTWTGASGRVLATRHDSDYADPGVLVHTRPSPETQLSRAAER